MNPEYKIGDKVTVAGIEFTKHSDLPFGPSAPTPRGHNPHPHDPEQCSCADELVPCRCLAYDPEENNHTYAEHTRCGGSLHNGVVPCGGCDDCMSDLADYYAHIEREEV